jgi:hypothetical protein
MHTRGHVEAEEGDTPNRTSTPSRRPRPVTTPEEWRVNVGRRTITHIKSGLVLKMGRGIRRGQLMALPVNLECMPRGGTRWPRALREAEALYHAALAAQHERQPEKPGESV